MRSIKLFRHCLSENMIKRSQLIRFYNASICRRAESSGKVTNHNVEKSPMTTLLWNERQKHNTFNANEKPMHAPTHLLEKSAADCRLTVRYNFSSDQNLRDAYVDNLGDVLTGKLLEDLDALAGNVAFMHCDDNNPETRPLSLVTASVDRIRQTNRISTSDDIVLVGQVAWVGRSSLDILMEIHRVPSEKDSNVAFTPTMITEPSDTRLLTSIFTYVARDKVTGKACQVNRYIPRDESEVSLYTHRETLANTRKAAAKKSSSMGVTTEQSADVPSTSSTSMLDIASLLQQGHAMEDMPALNHQHAVLMKHTRLENCLLCQPQNTNTGGKVFGGFLMHRAYSLAEATAYLFAGVRPHFLEVDRIEFTKPVDIGDLVRLRSRVLYSSSNRGITNSSTNSSSGVTSGSNEEDQVVMVEVTCQIVRPEKASSFLSNRFFYVFVFPSGCTFEGTSTLKQVLPVTPEEANALAAASLWEENH